jgi:hypothetical protein
MNKGVAASVDIDKSLPYKLLDETIGIDIEILTNDYQETSGYPGSPNNTYQRIVFQVREEEPDLYAVGVLFALSLMSFTFAAPRGYSEVEFIPDEEWSLGYFIQGLEFRDGYLKFSSDYVSGRLMKTDITFKPEGRVILETRNRGKGGERWLTHLQGKRHIRPVE